MPPSPQESTRRWAANLKAARKSIEAGVRGVTESPTAAAARKVDKYVAGVQASVESGRYQAGLNRVSREDWINSVVTKGLARLDTGVTAAEPKMAQFMAEFLPYAAQVSQSVKSMPNNTEQERDERMLAAVRQMRAFKRGSGRSY